MKANLNTIKEGDFYFLEKYGYWQDYGKGIMLCHLDHTGIHYVMFYLENHWKKIVISDKLLELYNKTN